MGKQGPCRHCGVTSTPLWRNGPPEKPVLCNACGSRWRTKGTLVNYTPLHARAEADDLEEYRIRRVKTISLKNKEAKVLKRKQNHTSQVGGGAATEYAQGYLKGGGPSGVALDYNRTFRKVLDEDTSNRSSSGSAISNSESCLQLANADASDLTGPAQSVVWDSMVPSRKRTCVNHPKQSSVEKLTKDLHTILHEQQSYLSGSSEEDLLVDKGHGSVLIRHPSIIACEEEYGASSLSIENKHHSINEAYSQFSSLHVHTSRKGVKFSSPGVESTNKPGPEIKQDQLIREKVQEEKLQLLANHNSPLCYIDLKVLLRMLTAYYNHVRDYQNTLVTKYFELRCVKLIGTTQKKVHFIIMGNLFCLEYTIQRRFDLKCSSLGRSIDKPESELDANTILKDLDRNFFFRLQKTWFQEFSRQIDRDCDFPEQ